MANSICVGMGEMVVSNAQDTDLVCLGLGSCIAVCAYAPHHRFGAIVHIVLPKAPGPAPLPGKYADTAIPSLVTAFRQHGVPATQVKIVLVGGAAIFTTAANSLMDIGQRNYAAVCAELKKVGWQAMTEDVGGRESRTVKLSLNDGIVRLRTVRTGEQVLAALGR